MSTGKRIVQMLPLLLLTLSWHYAQSNFNLLYTWPEHLLAIGLLILCVAWVISFGFTAFFTAGGYLAGLLAGQLFNTGKMTPGGPVDTTWIIWLLVYVAAIVMGVILDVCLYLRRKRKKQ